MGLMSIILTNCRSFYQFDALYFNIAISHILWKDTEYFITIFVTKPSIKVKTKMAS